MRRANESPNCLSVRDEGLGRVLRRPVDPGHLHRPVRDARRYHSTKGAKLDIPCADFWYVEDGKIKESNCYASLNIMLAQLGVQPDFASAVGAQAAIQPPPPLLSVSSSNNTRHRERGRLKIVRQRLSNRDRSQMYEDSQTRELAIQNIFLLSVLQARILVAFEVLLY
jgi:hypothetical protein